MGAGVNGGALGHLTNTVRIFECLLLIARGGIEPPTRGPQPPPLMEMSTRRSLWTRGLIVHGPMKEFSDK